MGYRWTHSYNARLRERDDGSVVELAPQGARLTFGKNADGSYSSPQGVYDVLTKAADGSYVLRKNNGVEWSFGADGKLAKITDPNGNALTFSYDTLGQLLKETDPLGNATSYAYDENGNMTSKTSGTTTTAYGYDYEDMLVKAGTKTYQRDAFGRVASSTVGTTTTEYVYDGAEEVQEKTGTTLTYYTRGLDGDSSTAAAAGSPSPTTTTTR